MSEIVQIANGLYEVLEGTQANPGRVFGPIMLNGEPSEPQGEYRVSIQGATTILINENPTAAYTAAQAAAAQAAADAIEARVAQVASHHAAYNAATTVAELRLAFEAAFADGFGVDEVMRG